MKENTREIPATWLAFKAMADLTEIPTVYNSSHIGYRSTLTRKQNQIRKAKNKQQRNSRKANR